MDHQRGQLPRLTDEAPRSHGEDLLMPKRHRRPPRTPARLPVAPVKPEDTYFPYIAYADAEARMHELARSAAAGFGLPFHYKTSCRSDT